MFFPAQLDDDLEWFNAVQLCHRAQKADVRLAIPAQSRTV